MNETLFRILNNVKDDENHEDIAYMCINAAIIKVVASGFARGGVPRGKDFIELLDRSIELMGTIFCLLFLESKPDDYIENMNRVRRQYAGLAANPELQVTFFQTITTLTRDGLLESLQTAVDGTIWRFLQRDFLQRG